MALFHNNWQKTVSTGSQDLNNEFHVNIGDYSLGSTLIIFLIIIFVMGVITNFILALFIMKNNMRITRLEEEIYAEKRRF